MQKLSKEELKELKSTPEGLLRKNIMQWEGHCDKMEARGSLTPVEEEDVQFRRLQVKRWVIKLEAA